MFLYVPFQVGNILLVLSFDPDTSLRELADIATELHTTLRPIVSVLPLN